MSCVKFERMIDPYLDGGLDKRDFARFEGHLASCPSCREGVARFQALDSLLDRAFEWPEWNIEAPPYFAQRVMANLPARQANGIFSWRFLHPIVAAASIVLAVGIGFLARDMFPGPQPAVTSSQQVRIIFFSPQAESVAIIGDFNEWGQREVTLAQASDKGVWEFALNLDPGVYHYNLLVDGERWVANPKSSTLVPDGFGGYNSVLVVSEKCQDDCS